MTNAEMVRAWKRIEELLSKIPDPILRNVIRYEFQQRAERDWGFCPAEIIIKKDKPEPAEEIEFTEEEQRLLDVIEAHEKYGVDIRTEEEKRKAHNFVLNNMCDFINMGGNYWQIPENIRCPELKKIYDEAFEIVFTF